MRFSVVDSSTLLNSTAAQNVAISSSGRQHSTEGDEDQQFHDQGGLRIIA
jgi:hypothetical protein